MPCTQQFEASARVSTLVHAARGGVVLAAAGRRATRSWPKGGKTTRLTRHRRRETWTLWCCGARVHEKGSWAHLGRRHPKPRKGKNRDERNKAWAERVSRTEGHCNLVSQFPKLRKNWPGSDCGWREEAVELGQSKSIPGGHPSVCPRDLGRPALLDLNSRSLAPDCGGVCTCLPTAEEALA